jgi:hypothetical protein
VPREITFITTSLGSGTEDVHYSQTISVSGGESPYTWSIASGTLPSGLSLRSSTGVISGTPDEDTAGTYNFTINVTDDSTPAVSAQHAFSLIIEVGTYESTITVGRGLKAGQTGLFVGGEEVATLEGGESKDLSFELGTSHTISVETTVAYPGKTDERFKAEIDRKVVDADSPDAEFDYYTECYVDFETEPSQLTQITASGWYEDGADLITNAPTEIDDEAGKQYRFSHWLLPNGQMVNDEYLSLTVDEPGSIVASYDTYYQVIFKTEPPEAAQMTGSGWYEEGHSLTASALAEIDDEPGTQYRFSYWQLSSGETVKTRDLNLAVSAAQNIAAHYETYYLLTLKSAYGEVGDSTWYKAGTEAQWAIESQEVPLPGAMGFLGGTRQAVNYSGDEYMNSPKVININWQSNYTRPILFISLIALGVGLALYFGVYRRRQVVPPTPVPVGPPPQPIAPPQTTVVMIGDGTRHSPQATKEQILERLSELLGKYEEEIRVSVEEEKREKLGAPGDTDEGRMLTEAQVSPSSVVDGESVEDQRGWLCNFSGKKLLRVVAGTWRQVETKTTTLPPDDKEASEGEVGLAVTWARDTYNEWQMLKCSLAYGHKGAHRGTPRLVYTLLNTVTEEEIYGPGEQVTPPTPHFTDGMPEVGITADQIVRYEQLPVEDLP